jgi:predicted RNA-binding protein YlqC (UPF0109 family)
MKKKSTTFQVNSKMFNQAPAAKVVGRKGKIIEAATAMLAAEKSPSRISRKER